SIKINGYCPAKLNVFENRETGYVKVNFPKTHVGHGMDLGRMTLSKSEQEEIAAKISQKIPFDQILNMQQQVSTVTQEDVDDQNLFMSVDPRQDDCIKLTTTKNTEMKKYCGKKKIEALKASLKRKFDEILEDVNNTEEYGVVEKALLPLKPILSSLKKQTVVSTSLVPVPQISPVNAITMSSTSFEFHNNVSRDLSSDDLDNDGFSHLSSYSANSTNSANPTSDTTNNSYQNSNILNDELSVNLYSKNTIDLLREWALTQKINHTALNALFPILNREDCGSCFKGLPKDARTF
ncbi:hypothetical protein NQ314_010641, partial [Rhamnusium bicolor]